MSFRCKTIRQLIDEASAPPRSRPGNVGRARQSQRAAGLTDCHAEEPDRAERIAAHVDRIAREEPVSQRVASHLNRRGEAGRRHEARDYLLAHGLASAKAIASAIRSHQRTVALLLAHPWFVRREDGRWTLTPAGKTGREESCS